MIDTGEILRSARRIAVLGMSDSSLRESYRIGMLLKEIGYEIIPVNPTIESVDGMPTCDTPADVPGQIDILNVFRNRRHADAVVDAAIEAEVPVLWFQLDTHTREAVDRAQAAGITVISNRCIAVDVRLHGISIAG